MENKVKNADDRSSHREVYRPGRNTIERGARIPVSEKIGKSLFQKLLDDTNQQQEDTSWSRSSEFSRAPEVREAVKPALSQRERYGHDKESFEKRFSEKESEREEVKAGSGENSGVPRGKIAEKKVIGRGALSERGSGGGGKQGESRQGMGGQGKRGGGFFDLSLLREVKSIRKQSLRDASQSRFALELASVKGQQPAVSTGVEGTAAGREIPKALLDQIVQYGRLMTKTDGDKEIDLQLREDFFKGLRLRVTMAGEKVHASFVTSSTDVFQFFQAQKGPLHQLLSEKGVDVGSILVIMK